MIFTSAIRGAPERFLFIPHTGRAKPRVDGLALFAEYLSDDCSPVVAARLAGYQPNDAKFLLKLCADLGPQAR